MWLIVGLGNPGRAYSKTRHNLGFMVIDAIAGKFSIPLDRESKNCVYGKGTIAGKDIILVKPLTFMNKSGVAVASLLKKFMRIEHIVVIHDDLDIDTGRLKIRGNGSSAGHRGIESIIESTGTKDFIRLKLGIGRAESINPEAYVLKNFSRQESPLVKKTIDRAVDAVEAIIDKGISYAQNKFHKEQSA